MPENKGAYLDGKKPLEIKSAPYTSPRENEIVIKNLAVAVNPVDWMIKDVGGLIFPYIKWPFIPGSDTAGQVVEVGSAVTRYKVGERVVGHAVSLDEKRNTTAESAFQTYTVLLESMASPIPDTISYVDASVIPLGVSTAACGLFQKEHLGLSLPAVNTERGSANKTVLIWGGSSSVGSCGIQLAVAAGYDVITTCSPRNFEFVKKLGASEAFDYKSPTVVNDIIAAFKGKTLAGALSTGYGAADKCLDILGKCEGNRFLSMATFPVPATMPDRFVLPIFMASYISGNASIFIKSKTRGIRTAFISGTSLVHNEVGKAIYQDYLPQALAERSFVTAPEPQVVGHGLDSLELALQVQKKGVSAKKIVVTL